MGAHRYIDSITKHRREFHGSKTDSTWATHIEGACGELAYAKFWNVYWDGSINTFKAPDVGAKTQVRTRSDHRYDLQVRPNERDGDFFVLVTGRAPTFYIRGFIKGADAKQQKWLKNYGGKGAAYFVPAADLRPFPSKRS